jgi:hypothetical protein
VLKYRARNALRQPADEQGSIIVALIIIMVVFALGGILASRVIGNESIVVNRQNGAAGLAGADGGLSDALFRLDQGPAATGTGNYFCVKPSDTLCAASSVPGAPGVTYQATANSSQASLATQWTIQAVGTVHKVPGAVQETATRTAQYPFALFGNTGLTFNGSAGNAFGTYTPGTDSSSNPNTSGAVNIGSNGTITCNGGLGSNVTSVYYSGGGGISGSCGTTQAVTTLYNLPPPQAPAGASACPGSGTGGAQFGAGAGGPSTISPGTYVCTTPVTIKGNVSISGTGQVNLYIILDPTMYNSSTTALDITAGSQVNAGFNADPPPNGATLPDASRLQILTNSTGTVGDTNGQGYTLGAILYAPQASTTGNGCKSIYYGALVINTLTCNGGPHLTVYYDSNLSTVYGAWVISGYLQIPPNSVIWH